MMKAKFIGLDGTKVVFEKEGGQRFTYLANELDLDSQSKIKELQKAAHLNVFPEALRARCSMSSRMEAIKAEGGEQKVEKAVRDALDWLAGEQDPNNGALGEEYKVGVTALALLAFLGHCETPASPKYGDTVVNATLYLMNRALKDDGLIFNGDKGHHAAYEHGIATYALAELLSMTKGSANEIPRLEPLLKKAIAIIVEGQTDMGGWAYDYKQSGKNDLSLAGWQLQALWAAHSSGAEFKGVVDALDKATGFLKEMQDDEGAFKYNPENPKGKLSLTGVGVYSLYKWGGKESVEHERGTTYLNRITAPTPGANYYAPYYYTLAFFMNGGEKWKGYSRVFMPKLLEAQNEDGSWLKPGGQGGEDSQILNTAWAAMMLEVFYRYQRAPIKPG